MKISPKLIYKCNETSIKSQWDYLGNLILKFFYKGTNTHKELRVLTKNKDRGSPSRHENTSLSHCDIRAWADTEGETDANGTKYESRNMPLGGQRWHHRL